MYLPRTLLKTVSYGFMHMSLAILVAYALSGSLRIAFAIGLIEPCVQTAAYFFHERAWHKFEKEEGIKDVHNSVIDSASPIGTTVEQALNQKPD